MNECVREARAKNNAFLLTLMADIDGVFGGSRHFRARFDTGRGNIGAIELAGARFCDCTEDGVISSAGTERPQQCHTNYLPRWRDRPLCRALAIVKGGGFDYEPRRAKAALQSIV